MPKALLLENIHPDAAQSLRDHGFEVECLKGALSEDELIRVMVENPRLIERPIVIKGAKAVVARPTADRIDEIL